MVLYDVLQPVLPNACAAVTWLTGGGLKGLGSLWQFSPCKPSQVKVNADSLGKPNVWLYPALLLVEVQTADPNDQNMESGILNHDKSSENVCTSSQQVN